MTLAKDQFTTLYEKHAYGSGDKKSWRDIYFSSEQMRPFFQFNFGRSIEIKDADSRIQDRLIIRRDIS